MDVVAVEKLTSKPDELWELMVKSGRICKVIEPSSIYGPVGGNSLRIVCIADTHERLGAIINRIPKGDVLIHAGDFTNFGEKEKIEEFDKIIGSLPHAQKIVIAGNHELGFEDGEDEVMRRGFYKDRGTKQGYRLLKNCIYLQDSEIKIRGIRIYGSSWHPLPGYSFSRERGHALLDKWNMIPAGIDVLITHSPPLGHMDNYKGEHWGCAELLNTVEQRVKPQFHVFGHVHEQHGLTTNGSTVFINCSICNHQLEPVNDPIIFDIPVKSTM